MDEHAGQGGRIIVTIFATAVALAAGLPIFAIGERIREGRSNPYPKTSPHNPKDTP